MSLPALFLLALASTAAGQSSRPKPVVMPFGLAYGEHSLGAWFSIPLTLGSQKFELGISTSLSQSWVPGKPMCDGASNVTDCAQSLGGVFDTGGSSTWKADSSQAGVKIEDGLLKSFYKTVGPVLQVQSGDSKKLLAMEGAGNMGTDIITLVSNTGSFKMADQAVGVITSGNKALMANGYLSLQQMALSLYAGQFTPSPSYHLFQGMSAGTNDSTLALDGFDYGKYSLIFGGYDSMLDLNTTQQYPLVATDLATGKTSTAAMPTDVALPPSEHVSYGMQVMLEDIVYRWTDGGGTDNSLLTKPRLAIVDSTTPWIWLPKSTFESFIAISGTVWNDTYSAYVMPYYCYSSNPCTPAQERSVGALLDFKFEQMNGDKLTLDFYNYFNVRYLPSNDTVIYVVPVRELPEDAPIILGRPFLAGIHLWVDYAERYWGMAQGNVTLQHITTSQVMPWDRNSHPAITNTSVLVHRLGKDDTNSSPNGSSNPAGPGGGGGKGMGIGAMAGIAGGGVVLLGLAVVGFCLFRRRKNRDLKTSDPNRPESMIELHAKESQKVSELGQGDQFSSHELPPNQSQFSKPAHPQTGYQELADSGKYQPPPPPPQQQGHYAPAGQAYHYPPPSPQQYPPPPNYDAGQASAGPVYYEMDASRGVR